MKPSIRKTTKIVFLTALIFLSVNFIVAISNDLREAIKQLPANEAIFFLADREEKLEERVNEQEEKLDREEACRKRNELFYPPAGWLEKHGGSVGGTTEVQIDFLQGELEERKRLGEEWASRATYWSRHSVGEVEEAIRVLESQWQEYLKYREICESE